MASSVFCLIVIREGSEPLFHESRVLFRLLAKCYSESPRMQQRTDIAIRNIRTMSPIPFTWAAWPLHQTRQQIMCRQCFPGGCGTPRIRGLDVNRRLLEVKHILAVTARAG